MLWTNKVIKIAKVVTRVLFPRGPGCVRTEHVGEATERPTCSNAVTESCPGKGKTPGTEEILVRLLSLSRRIFFSWEVLEALPGRPISGERLDFGRMERSTSVSMAMFSVAGLTLPEVKEKIVLHLRRYLTDEVLGLADGDGPEIPYIDDETKDPRLRDPKMTDRVFVDLTGYNSCNYYVEGDVLIPGTLPYTGNATVLDVIHFAGGVLPSADRSKIRLIRSFPKGSPVEVLPINYDEVVMGTDSSTNYQILPNDRLVVPPKLDDQPQEIRFRRGDRSRTHRDGR